VAVAAPARAQVDARMFRFADVSASQIAFVYAGDIWLVTKQGGVATRLSSPPGQEMLPRFSPDGTRLAFSARYDGNLDVYVIPTTGGDPVRVTHHPKDDLLVGWHPDGKRLLFVSSRESGRQRYNQFYLVDAGGGLPEKLPVPYGEFGAFSPDGRQFAYMPQSGDFRTWKRYRGGWAPDIWLFDLKTFASKNLTNNEGNDAHPMWHGTTMYFVSDRGPGQRNNLWAYSLADGRARQVTDFRDLDITFPAIGPGDIVFQAGGRLYLLDLATEKYAEVPVQVVTDRLTMKPGLEKAEKLIVSWSASPAGKRAVFEARGDVVTVPAEHGPVLNVTRSSGVAERYPRWSPDGRTVAYWSDRSGEYELTVRPADGSGAERKVTSLGRGFRYTPYWSPDSKSVAFVDQAGRMHVADLASGKVTQVDESPEWLAHGALQDFTFAWSADSRWLAWSRAAETKNPAVFLYDTRVGKARQVTSGYFADSEPAFDPGGKYLFYASNRSFEPVYSDFDNSWAYPNATRLVAVPLRDKDASPLAPRNDVEGGEPKAADKDADQDQDKDAGKGKDAPAPDPASASASRVTEKADTAKTSTDAKASKPEKPVPVEIDLDGFEARAVVLPPKAGNYSGLAAVKGKLLYLRRPRTGSGDEKSQVVYYDLEEREEKTVVDDADGFEATADGKKLLVWKKRQYHFVDLKPAQKLEKPLRVAEVEVPVDPRAEWRQIFNDAYRFERDYFYDPNMHGVDWEATRDRYATLLDAAVTRWDVNFVIGEFIAELNASHTYRGGGAEQQAPTVKVGMLGVDWSLENGAYRIERIVRGGPWDADARSPLGEPGTVVKEGDYVLAVNGVPLDVRKDPWAAFAGLGEATAVLTVNARPTPDGARQIVVKLLDDDHDEELRFREWIEARRRRVDEASGGRVGYVYVQSTGRDAQSELVRQFMAQWRKDGLIIDERFNSGGQIPDRFIELLNRPRLSYWATRHGREWPWPPVSHRGPKAMLINGWSGSGGDAFPFYFRMAALGPLIGKRTWGGLIGISGVPGLVDGGSVTAPTFRMYDVEGRWFAEGHGVEPDIVVEEDPTQLAKGVDPQLERAIEDVMRRVKEFEPAPGRPEYERRTAPTN
jgi:tricorn protease